MCPLRREWGANDVANNNNNSNNNNGNMLGRPAVNVNGTNYRHGSANGSVLSGVTHQSRRARMGGSALGVNGGPGFHPAAISQQPNIPRSAGYGKNRGAGSELSHVNTRQSYRHYQPLHQQQLVPFARVPQRHPSQPMFVANNMQKGNLQQMPAQQRYHYQSQPHLYEPRQFEVCQQATPVYPPPPPPYSTMPRHSISNLACVKQQPSSQQRRYPQSEIAANNQSRFYHNHHDNGANKHGVIMYPPYHQQQQHNFRSSMRHHYPQQEQLYQNGGFDANPIDFGFAHHNQGYNGDVQLGPPSPQSVDIEYLEDPEPPPPFIMKSFSKLEVFIKIFAILSLLFPPTGIGAVVCAFTANKESSKRFRAARQKVSLILASVGFTALLIILVVAIISLYIVH